MAISSSSSSLIRNPQKVCVVCRRRTKGYLEYWIYIVDLNSTAGDCYTRRDPTFRIREECFSNPCFCVLGSTLYVFQGYEFDYDADKFITRGKTVYTYPLPSSDTANLRLTKSMMSVAKAPLKDVKWNPIAVPTPDGKQILIVSTVFEKLRQDSICSFELYDPSRQTSTVIRASPIESRSLHVHSVKFIGPRTVLVLTYEGPYNTGCLTLHLDEDHPNNWVNEWEWSRNVDRMKIQIPFILRHGWCFTASSARDICDDHKLYGFNFQYPSRTLWCGGDVTALSDADSFCTLRMGQTSCPCIMLGVYKFDFIKHRKEVAEVCEKVCERVKEEMKDLESRDEENGPPFKRRRRERSIELPGVETVKSIRFFDARQLDEDENDSFDTVSFFYIPTST